MSFSQTVLLGALAGFTIFLGLPLARVRSTSRVATAALNAFALGILLFLLWDVLAQAVEPVEEALHEATDGTAGWGEFVGLAALLAGGVATGLLTLVYYDRWIDRRIRPSKLIGPGAAALAEYERKPWLATLSPGRRLALLIATGIGLHNFGEGLAIGQSAAAGELALALTLIIGFGLHNATEGFGIVGPMAGETSPPSWAFLALLGLIGGGPTFIGTVIGQAWVSEAVSVVFFAIAAGSILFVVQELFALSRRSNRTTLTAWMLLLGLALGFGTDFVLEAIGG
jgi:zinc transporter, ZIP family